MVGAALPAASSAALVSLRGTVPNTDIALLITGAVLIVATSGRRSAAAVAALSAAVSFDYYHTLPYHSLSIANHNDALATLVLGLLALAVGQIAAHASNSHIELVFVAGAAVLSQAVPDPARFLVDHRGLDVSLAVLVFATALAIPPRTFRGLAGNAWRLAAAVVSTAMVLPALSWAVSHFVPSVALRRGVLTVGLAPAEIASVATTSLAGGDTAVAAAMLVTSSLLTVAAAGVGLRLLGGGGTIHLIPLLTNLGLVVGAPMVAGIAIRTGVTLSPRQEAAAERLSVAVVTLLVWLVASQVRLSSSYLAVAGALLVFLIGSAILGAALGFRAPPPVAKALLLTTSMRDFAIAAGIAVAAFGAASAAPLGLYGVMVIGWGMAVATLRPTAATPTLALPGNGPAIEATSPVYRAPPTADGAASNGSMDSPHHSETQVPPAEASLLLIDPEHPRFEPSPSSVICTATAEADASAIVALSQPGQPGIIGFVARAAIDALNAAQSDGISAPAAVTLGVIRHNPTGLSFHIVERADELRLRALDRTLTVIEDNPTCPTSAAALWISNGSSAGVSTAVTVAYCTVLSIGALRREPRIIDTPYGEAIVARHLISLTITYPKTHPDPTDLLVRIVDAIQNRDWSTEL